MARVLRTCTVTVLLISTPAFAYVGPGAGITMLAALWGVLLAILAALGAVLYWPIKSMLNRKKKAKAEKAAQAGKTQAPDVTEEREPAPEPSKQEDSLEYERGN